MRADLRTGIIVGVVLIVVMAIVLVRRHNSGSGDTGADPAITVTGEESTDDISPELMADEQDNDDIVVIEVPPRDSQSDLSADAPELPELLRPARPELLENDESRPAKARPQKHTARQIRYYVVRKGDTLFGIAEQFYGHGRYSKDIYQANLAIITDPDSLKPGWKLRIPLPEELAVEE